MSSDTSASKPSNVLILGASGRIGRLLRKVWGGETSNFIRPLWQYRKKPDSDGLNLDFMNDKTGLHEALKMVDSVLVLAGVTPGTGTKPSDYQKNVEIAETVLEAAKHVGLEKVLLTSTAAVYGNAEPGPFGFRETNANSPINLYGKSKVEMEHAAVANGTTRTCCLRIGNIAGADQLLAPGRRGVEIDVFPDGRGPRRTYLGPRMLASVLAQLLTTNATLPSTLNIGGGHPIDMLDLLRAANMQYKTRPAPEGLPEIACLDCSAMRSLVNEPHGTGNAEVIVSDWLAVTEGEPT